MPTKPKLFIGSSKDSLEVATLLHFQLVKSGTCEPTIWKDGVFYLSRETLSSLILATRTYDFAVLLLTPDDNKVRKGIRIKTVRDNILIEMGLFLGALGQERTFLVQCQDDEVNIPTDIIAVQRVMYERRDDMRQAMVSVATEIGLSIKEVLKQRQSDHTVACTDFIKTMINRCPGKIKESDLYLLQRDGAITTRQYAELTPLL